MSCGVSTKHDSASAYQVKFDEVTLPLVEDSGDLLDDQAPFGPVDVDAILLGLESFDDGDIGAREDAQHMGIVLLVAVVPGLALTLDDQRLPAIKVETVDTRLFEVALGCKITKQQQREIIRIFIVTQECEMQSNERTKISSTNLVVDYNVRLVVIRNLDCGMSSKKSDDCCMQMISNVLVCVIARPVECEEI